MISFLQNHPLLTIVLGFGMTIVAAIHLVWYIRPSDIKTKSEFDVVVRNGQQPTIVEYYNNLCTACSLMKPVVDNLEKDLAGQATVLRIDFLSEVGRSTARQYEVKIIPTILVLDPYGGVVFRQTGTFDSELIKSKVMGLQNHEPEPIPS
ncbi:MAG: thioredoxin family protein [Anaerolineae bacterium]|nr:thioredoxin family protein [Anaerolineae bacterium]